MTESLEAYVPEMIRTRRTLHRRPEVGWTEFETTALVMRRLEGLGYKVLCGTSVIDPRAVLGRDPDEVEQALARARTHGVGESELERMQGYSGCVGILETGRPGPVVVFRHDMDALPVQELTDPASGHLPAVQGFASEIALRMHACGHDAHTALGLSLARWLMDHREELCGTIKLLFQPAEEGTRGAAAMAASGIVDDADWLFAAHMGTCAHTGQIRPVTGGFLATTKFNVDFTGTPSHAGGNPEKGRSALIAAANAAIMLTAIPRTSQGDTRISVGRLDAGEGRNITPVHAHMECEVRGASDEANNYMMERARAVIHGCALAQEVDYTITKTGEACNLHTDQQALEVIRSAARTVPGIEVADAVCVGSEDCTILTKRVMEHGGHAGYFLIGCEHHGHHRPDFDVQDEVNLRPGLQTFAAIASSLCGCTR
ncbi:MAG: amidohydrolase [Duodenibacillus sp.]|nr:amidohydrolase [Duodenibacillus sp.]